jgi:hypothetical protein
LATTMTNYCSNRLRISGTPLDIAAFARDCLASPGQHSWLDPDKILPVPKTLAGTNTGIGTNMGWDADIGIEILTRQPRPGAPSALACDQARKLRIKNHDDLERWAAKHRPNAIELGRKCLSAFEQTGYWFERDWKNANWGTAWLQDFEIVRQTDSDFEATFATAWAPAYGIYHELARRFPGLKIIVSAIEEGQDVSYHFEAHDNNVREDSPGLTEELVEEVRGEPSKIDEFYLRTPEPRPMPATRSRLRFAEHRIKRKLAAYLTYAPPHAGIEMAMSEKDAEENFAYFMSQRATRIEHLRSLLARFDIALEFSDATKHALDRWIAKYGAFLYVEENGSSFVTYTPPWRDVRAGWNVIFDLAIFLGEFVIKENPALHWEMYRDVPSGLRKENDRYRKPIIAGFPERPQWRLDLMTEVHRICHALRETSFAFRAPLMTISPRKLYTNFASMTLLKVHLEAQGNYEAANELMLQAALAEKSRKPGLIAGLWRRLIGP